MKVFKLLLVLAISATAFATPAAAYSMSSNDGAGTSWRAWKTSQDTVDSAGFLKSYRSKPVYVAGQAVVDWGSDRYCGRITSNTTSRSYRWKSAWTCTERAPWNDVDGEKWRVCHDRRFWRDPCGGFSGTDKV